jgi:hypothetical protein
LGARHATIADLPECFCNVAAGDKQEAITFTQPLVGLGVAGPCGLIACELHVALASHWLAINPRTGGGEVMAFPYRREIDKLEVGEVGAEEFLSPFSLRRTRWGELYLQLCAAHCKPSLMVV